MAPAQQSVAITALGVLNFLLGGLLAAAGVSSMVMLWVFETAADQIDKEVPPEGTSFREMMDKAGPPWTAISFGILLAGCLFIASAYGLIKRRRWGRRLALLLASMEAVITLAGIFSTWVSMDGCSMLASVGYCVFCCVVLFRRKYVAEFP